MPKWKKGDPFRANKGEMLEGIPEIATFLGKSYNTVWRWIHDHELPAMKTPKGVWLSHPQLILMWVYANKRVMDNTVDYAPMSDEELAELIDLGNH